MLLCYILIHFFVHWGHIQVGVLPVNLNYTTLGSRTGRVPTLHLNYTTLRVHTGGAPALHLNYNTLGAHTSPNCICTCKTILDILRLLFSFFLNVLFRTYS